MSTLSLVDLAGSESVRLANTHGKRQIEGGFINKSLLTLGKVVSMLTEEGQTNTCMRKLSTQQSLLPAQRVWETGREHPATCVFCFFQSHTVEQYRSSALYGTGVAFSPFACWHRELGYCCIILLS